MNAKPPSRSFNFSALTNRMTHSFRCSRVCVREQLPRQPISPLSSDISFLQRMIMTLYCSIMKQRETYEGCFWISTPKQLNLWSLRSISPWRTWQLLQKEPQWARCLVLEYSALLASFSPCMNLTRQAALHFLSFSKYFPTHAWVQV